MIAAVLTVAVVWFVLRRVRRRKAVLAGLEATRPTYSVQPPSLRLGRRRDEAL